jgi:hypothetical protein
MYRVTILFDDAEIGFGEGESAEYAMQEAVESVPSIYADFESEWTFKTGHD